MKYTPKPWRVNDGVTRNHDTFRHAIEGPERVIAWTLRHFDRDLANRKTTDQDDADANLIASAPDLLEACKAAYQECDDDDYLGSDLAKMLKKAITKAEGK